MKNGHKPAFAHSLPKDVEYVDTTVYDGLTKREYFAGLAMQGLLANNVVTQQHVSSHRHLIAQHSVAQADELLKQLDSTNPL